MPSVLLLKAGTSLPLSLKTPMSGTWQAEYGVVDSNGKYQAPPYIPATGNDTITFTHGDCGPVTFRQMGGLLRAPKRLATDYKKLTLSIRILPNPAIPGSGETPYIVSAPIASIDPNGEEQRLGENSGIIFPKIFPLPPAKFLRTRAVLKPGEKLDPPFEFTRIRPVAFSHSRAAYILPALDQTSEPADALRVSVHAIRFVPQWAKELPQLPGNPDDDPDPRTDTRPDVEKAVNTRRASHARRR